MAAVREASILSLTLVALTLLLSPAQAFASRSLSQLPSPTALPNATLRSNVPQVINAINATIVLPYFPANLTGDLRGIILPNATELAKIEQYVLNRTRPAVLSFVDKTNVTIDCVAIQAQLSMLQPLLKNHTIQFTPPIAPLVNLTTARTIYPPLPPPINGTIPAIITPNVSATSALNSSLTCPNGSVPVPRLTVADIARFGSLQAFLNAAVKKVAPPPPSTSGTTSNGHEYAETYGDSTQVPVGYGLQTYLTVWAPYVEQFSGNYASTEFSLSQLWVLGGKGNKMQSIEAGWQVEPLVYGDTRPHLFIYSTLAGYTDGTCYAGRSDCLNGTFVQVSKTVYPTMTLQASSMNGTTVQHALLIVRDFKTGNWWVKFDNEWVGYYPGSLYTALAKSADTLSLGGEIVDTARLPNSPIPGGPHTRTQMGSGMYGALLAPGHSVINTAYHYRPFYVDAKNNLQTLPMFPGPNDGVIGYDPACYNGQVSAVSPDNVLFFFGGPGYNPYCLT